MREFPFIRLRRVYVCYTARPPHKVPHNADCVNTENGFGCMGGHVKRVKLCGGHSFHHEVYPPKAAP